MEIHKCDHSDMDLKPKEKLGIVLMLLLIATWDIPMLIYT